MTAQKKDNERHERIMTEFNEAIEYVSEKVMEAIDQKEYPNTHDIADVIHAELDYYCSTMYESEATDIIISYGLTKALQEYDNQGFADYPKTSFALLYVIMLDQVQERVEKVMEKKKAKEILLEKGRF